ncbi:MAG: O-methyltransferase [Lachnoclostridium sp.]|jgi:predicted O-methyltransferase YrrM|nr:O-methyltransferase [Lachnoclostridium sp.]
MMQERMDIFFEVLVNAPENDIDRLEEEAIKMKEPVISRPVRNLLRYLLKTKRPESVLEIGTAIGYSALFMIDCLGENSEITTIEKVPARIIKARANFERYGKCDQIRLMDGDAADILPELAAAGKHYDFVFMDAAKGQYINFLPYIMQMLNPDGILLSDNILHGGDVLESRFAIKRRDRTIHSRMRQYLKNITSHPDLETICLPVGDGVALSTKIINRGTAEENSR